MVVDGDRAAGPLTDAAVRAALDRVWGLTGAQVLPHHGGTNSQTWTVAHARRRYVAKSVPAAAARDFTGGLAVAAHLQWAGIATGAPVLARDGRSVVPVAGRPLAVLVRVPGRPLGEHDQPVIGATLARVHRVSSELDMPAARQFHRVDPAAPHLAVRPWVRPAVAAAVDAVAELDPRSLTWGLLHTDPAPEAFRLDPAAGCGLTGWSVALAGPLLYDLASAVLYAGGPDAAAPLVDAYLADAPVTAAEVRRGLGTMLRFRWAVQADHFARRVSRGDLTGVAGPADGERGRPTRDGIPGSAAPARG